MFFVYFWVPIQITPTWANELHLALILLYSLESTTLWSYLSRFVAVTGDVITRDCPIMYTVKWRQASCSPYRGNPHRSMVNERLMMFVVCECGFFYCVATHGVSTYKWIFLGVGVFTGGGRWALGGGVGYACGRLMLQSMFTCIQVESCHSAYITLDKWAMVGNLLEMWYLKCLSLSWRQYSINHGNGAGLMVGLQILENMCSLMVE